MQAVKTSVTLVAAAAPFAFLAASVVLPDGLRASLSSLWRLDPEYRRRQLYHEVMCPDAVKCVRGVFHLHCVHACCSPATIAAGLRLPSFMPDGPCMCLAHLVGGSLPCRLPCRHPGGGVFSRRCRGCRAF